MKELNGKVAVVTGAASGIGRALAENLAAQGCRLALSDIRAADLEETASLLNFADKDIFCGVVDVSDLAAMEAFANDVLDHFGQVDIVINNAGIGCHGMADELDINTFRKVIDINMWGVIYGTRVFMPHLKKRPESSLVNISSINGMVPFPKQVPYNMSKYAVLGLNETLMMELKGSGVKVLSVHPGAIKTNIANYGIEQPEQNKSAFDKLAMTTSEKAAEQIVKGIKKKKSQIFIGADAKIFQFIKRCNARAALALSDFVIRTVGPRL